MDKKTYDEYMSEIRHAQNDLETKARDIIRQAREERAKLEKERSDFYTEQSNVRGDFKFELNEVRAKLKQEKQEIEEEKLKIAKRELDLLVKEDDLQRKINKSKGIISHFEKNIPLQLARNELIEEEEKRLNEFKVALYMIAKERKIGFPWMANKIVQATEIICENSYQRKEAYRYRESLKEIEILKSTIKYFQNL